MQIGDEYLIHITTIGDSTYCLIKTEVYKGQPGKPIMEGTTFGRVVHGSDFSDNQNFFLAEHQRHNTSNLTA